MAETINADEQFDDHCRMTFSGQDWWIFAARPGFLYLTNESSQCIVDYRFVDWPAYNNAAEHLTASRFPEAANV